MHGSHEEEVRFPFLERIAALDQRPALAQKVIGQAPFPRYRKQRGEETENGTRVKERSGDVVSIERSILDQWNDGGFAWVR